MTIGGSWGFEPDDTSKSATTLVHTLCEVAGRGGNLLLNVGPQADGSLPPEQVERLRSIATWMAHHAEAIYDTEPGFEPEQWYGPSTRRGDRWYAIATARPYETAVLRGVPVRRIERVVHLATGTELPFTTRMAVVDELLHAPDPMGELTVPIAPELIDDVATVLAVDISSR
jgi:alpha-L-fucosidase